MISYGYSVKEHDDPLVNIVEAATRQFSESVEHGAFIVDMVPPRKLRFLHQLIAGSTECTLSLPHSTHTRNRHATSARPLLFFVRFFDRTGG